MRDDEALKIISRAWGRKQEDRFAYAFFPWIDRDEQAAAGLRQAGFHEGPAFRWPLDRDKILAHMRAHHDHDLYWCPNLFEYPERKTENATDEHALWADLDGVDPRKIVDYPPSTAWETSPGRYQALWIINIGDIQGASWAGNENQQLTYHLGADLGGWDTTQLLRIPGWTNHKYDYRVDGKSPEGKLLWKNQRDYLPDEFTELPPVEGMSATLTDTFIYQVEGVDVAAVRARIRLDLKHRVRELLSAKVALGDRSAVLWDIERSLADVGCTLEEIVALVRNTVWNKYDGRGDELKRLVIEASKAIDQRTAPVSQEDIFAEEAQALTFPLLDDFLRDYKPPRWLVQNLIAEGSVGFIAGEPKAFKSWFGLDLALSVATGSRFLNYFDVVKPGPVLYIQEEDSPPTVKNRLEKIRKDKQTAQVRMVPNGGKPDIYFDPPMPVPLGAPIYSAFQSGLTLSEPVWQERLDEELGQHEYVLIVIDTLMMVAGMVDENRAQEMMTKIYKPLKQLARKHGVAIIVVHHLRKSTDGRTGQRLLGSVANHAWSDNSLYLTLTRARSIALEMESKFIQAKKYLVAGVGEGIGWRPNVSVLKGKQEKPIIDGYVNGYVSLHKTGYDAAEAFVQKRGQAGIKTIARQVHLSQRETRSIMNRLTSDGKVKAISYSMWGVN